MVDCNFEICVFQDNDKLLLSLLYDPNEERLTLGIKNVTLGSHSLSKIKNEGKNEYYFWQIIQIFFFKAGLYVKVTLFESSKVIKAKKTHPIQVTENSGNFEETFSILFPESFMNQVSCIISLNFKTRMCGKFCLGRTKIGQDFNDHWSQMKSNLGKPTEQWHELMAP